MLFCSTLSYVDSRFIFLWFTYNFCICLLRTVLEHCLCNIAILWLLYCETHAHFWDVKTLFSSFAVKLMDLSRDP